MTYDMATLLQIYNGSNGDDTKALYDWLKRFGPAGDVATNLFRAEKCSARAKAHLGRGYTSEAYRRKEWAIGNLCDVLVKHSATLGIDWGWAFDQKTPVFSNLLYVELPTIGQCSYHTFTRLAGPDYVKPWDGKKGVGPQRICQYILIVATNGVDSQRVDSKSSEQSVHKPTHEYTLGCNS